MGSTSCTATSLGHGTHMVYRTFKPSVSRGLATVAVDGRQMIISPNGEAAYVDVPAGQSQIQVENATESAKAKDLNLAPGQVAFVRIVVYGGQGAHRPIYDVKLESPAVAKADIAQLR